MPPLMSAATEATASGFIILPASSVTRRPAWWDSQPVMKSETTRRPFQSYSTSVAATPQSSWCEEVIFMPAPAGSILKDQIPDAPAEPR